MQLPQPKASDRLGEIITWDTSGANVTIADTRQALLNAGLDATVARDLDATSTFSRASRHLTKERAIDKVDVDKQGIITFQLTHKEIVERADGTKLMDHDYECQVELNSKTGEITCDEDSDIERLATQLFAQANIERTSSDITRIVQRLFKAHADLFSINPQKGVAYFVPDEHREFTAKIEKFLELTQGRLWRFPVPKGTPQGNKSVMEAVTHGLQTLLDELNESVDGWDEKTRPTTMKNTIDRWRLIEHKLLSYSTYLGSQQSHITEELAKAKERLVDTATGLRDIQKAKKAAKKAEREAVVA